MAEVLVNNFLVGADPEIILLDPPILVNGQRNRTTPPPFYGWDHGGYVLEPHPTPALSVRQVLHNTKKSLDVAARDFPNYRFRAGAYYKNGGERSITMGGHVHLDIPDLSVKQLKAMDFFSASLEDLDILPTKECRSRLAAGNYGIKGDVRKEHGHVEYRSMCSWLFSRKTSMLCMTGIKLCAVAPETVKRFQSPLEMKEWLEGFKGKDDDVDWILNRGYFDTPLTAKPDSDVKNVWRVTPEKAKDWEKELPVPDPTLMGGLPQVTMLEAVERVVARGVALNRTNLQHARTLADIAQYHLRAVAVLRRHELNLMNE